MIQGKWIATLIDGRLVDEKTTKWSDIKGQVNNLSFVYRGTEYFLPKCEEYMQAKTASAPLFGGENVQIESRWIGGRLNNGQIIKLRFYENENKVTVETE